MSMNSKLNNLLIHMDREACRLKDAPCFFEFSSYRFRVRVGTDSCSIMDFDSCNKTHTEEIFDTWDDLPKWAREKIAVLMISEEGRVKGIGRTHVFDKKGTTAGDGITEWVYWIETVE